MPPASEAVVVAVVKKNLRRLAARAARSGIVKTSFAGESPWTAGP
jgi:hypothetical protein